MQAPEVHVACASTGDMAPHDWAELDGCLQAEEREKADRFRFQADRNAFVLSRALLRALVGGLSGRTAASVRIGHDGLGMPHVEGEPRWHVSNSRTRLAVACAVTLAGPVGIDVEGTSAPEAADADLLSSFVASSSGAAGGREFFARWALLEAFWKSWGTGLAKDNARIVLSPLDSGRFDIRTEDGTGLEGKGWVLDSLDDCAMALVLRGPLQAPLHLCQTRCCSALEIKQLSNAIKPEPCLLPV